MLYKMIASSFLISGVITYNIPLILIGGWVATDESGYNYLETRHNAFGAVLCLVLSFVSLAFGSGVVGYIAILFWMFVSMGFLDDINSYKISLAITVGVMGFFMIQSLNNPLLLVVVFPLFTAAVGYADKIKGGDNNDNN